MYGTLFLYTSSPQKVKELEGWIKKDQSENGQFIFSALAHSYAFLCVRRMGMECNQALKLYMEYNCDKIMCMKVYPKESIKHYA